MQEICKIFKTFLTISANAFLSFQETRLLQTLLTVHLLLTQGHYFLIDYLLIANFHCLFNNIGLLLNKLMLVETVYNFWKSIKFPLFLFLFIDVYVDVDVYLRTFTRRITCSRDDIEIGWHCAFA